MAVPTIVAYTPIIIGSNSALGAGNVTSNGGKDITEKGICWNTTGTPTTADDKFTITGSTIGLYSGTIGSLSADTLYYIRAYAINADGTGYSTEVSFTTLANATPSLKSLNVGFDRATDPIEEQPILKSIKVDFDRATDPIEEQPILKSMIFGFSRPTYVEDTHPILRSLSFGFDRPVYENPMGYGNPIMYFLMK